MVNDRLDTISSSPRDVGQDFIERMVLRSMNEGVITLECDGSIHTVNPAAQRILGLEESDVRGKHFETVFSDDPVNEDFTKIIREAIQNNYQNERKEAGFKRNDGQIIDLSVTSSFVQVDECLPAIESAVVVFRDITAFKSLERMKKRAVNHLSHELKTPIAIIQASVENLNETDLTLEKYAKNIQRIQRNLDRLANIQEIVEEILNPPPFQPKRFPVKRFIEEILDKIRGRAAHRSVALISHLDSVDTAIVDPRILEIVLETLVKNAIENTPDGGKIIISLKVTDSGLLLQVQDNGIGIAVQDQEFIFEGFHHTQPTDEYSSKKPFDFNAGGKGLELLRLKALAESDYFDIRFETAHCKHISSASDHCSGSISSCPHVKTNAQCPKGHGTTFSVLFR